MSRVNNVLMAHLAEHKSDQERQNVAQMVLDEGKPKIGTSIAK